MAADDTDTSPVPPKKLSLKEVAARFEAGDADVLEDYRMHNLKESGEQLQQTLLQNMPKGKALMKELVKLAEELQGRVAGRNSEDAAQIKAGLLDLQAQWKSYEQSAKQAAKELTENAAASEAATQSAAAEQEHHLQARIEQLEDECATLRNQVAEHDSTVQQLHRELETCRRSPADQKENYSPMRDSSNFGSAEYGSPMSARGSPTKRFPTLTTLGEEAVSPAVIRSLSIAGRPWVGQTLSVVGPDRTARDNLPLQWLREGPAEGQVSVISGAVRNQYSPEVADVGCTICCRVGVPRDASSDAGGSNVLRMAAPVTADASLAEETAQLEAAGGHTFFVVPVQHNGVVQRKRTVASLRADVDGLSVSLGGSEIATAAYHADMQVCGARGGGDGAAQGMFLALNSKHVFMLALETPHKRNICIGLIRALAARAGLQLEGPQEGL